MKALILIALFSFTQLSAQDRCCMIDEVCDSMCTKVIKIGDWNMVLDRDKGVVHGLDFRKIRSIEVIIINDAQTVIATLDAFTIASGTAGGVSAVNAGIINLARRAGGLFDCSNYDSFFFNRGWVTIEYWQ